MRTGSDVPVREPVIFALVSDEKTQHKGSNIKFPTFIEQQLRLVTLDYRCTVVLASCSDSLLDLIKRTADENVPSSVGIFSWFYYPQVVLLLVQVEDLLEMPEVYCVLRYDVVGLRNHLEQFVQLHIFVTHLPTFK